MTVWPLSLTRLWGFESFEQSIGLVDIELARGKHLQDLAPLFTCHDALPFLSYDNVNSKYYH